MNVSRWSLDQLMVWLGLCMLAVIVLPLGVVFAGSELRLNEQRIEEHGKSLASIVAGQVVDPMLVGDRLSLLDTLEKIASTDVNITYICIVDPRGNVVSHTFRNGFPVRLSEAWNAHRGGAFRFRTEKGPVIDVSAPILSGRLGFSHVGLSRKKAVEGFSRLLAVLAAGLVCASGIVFLGSRVVAERVVGKPLHRLEQEVARFIPDSNAEIAAEIHGTREVESLSRGFRDMAQRLVSLEHEREVTRAKMVHAERLSALGGMAAGLAHEIRNPLDGMMECVRYLEADPEKSPRQAKFLPMIREGLDRINAVMRNVLTFAHSGDVPSAEACPTADIVSSLELLLQGKLKSRNIRLTWHKPSGCLCLCSQQAVVQALLNLVLNSADAVEKKEHPEILIEARCDERWVYLSVEDNGDGIPENLREKIFEPFFTTKPIGQGTGLGLPISRQIIRAVGGELVVSAPKTELGGARFDIRIPRIYQ